MTSDTECADDVVVAAGLIYPPAGRRREWCVIVQRCPLCLYAHRHRADEFARTMLRSPSCRPWSVYLVHGVVVVPQAQVVS